MRDQFIATLEQVTEEDPRVMLLTGDLGFGVFDKYRKRFPKNFLNIGVAEQNMTGIATGLALEGRIIFTYSIANFATLRCLEFIRNDCCYHDANVNVVSVGAGFSYGQLGISHHATEDISIMRSLPSMVVLSPGCDWEAAECTRALAMKPGAGYLRIDRAGVKSTQQHDERFVLGRARVVRVGGDVTLVATGGMLAVALEAAETLSKSGISVRVISVPTIKPLDVDTLGRAAEETGGIVTLEEHTIDGGLGGAVAEALLEAQRVPRFFYRCGLRSGFSSIVGDQNYLRTAYNLDAPAVVSRVRSLVGRATLSTHHEPRESRTDTFRTEPS